MPTIMSDVFARAGHSLVECKACVVADSQWTSLLWLVVLQPSGPHPLHEACRRSDCVIVEALISRGADINAREVCDATVTLANRP
jgi:ankyrin repeat protein